MSPHIVEDKVINSILGWIHSTISYDRPGGTHLARLAVSCGLAISLETTNDMACEGLENCGHIMAAMNERAVKVRYRPVAYQYVSLGLVDTMQAYKYLRGFLYQYVEGGVLDSKLYMAWHAVLDYIGHMIIISTDEYTKAEWA